MPELITGTKGTPHVTSTQDRSIYEKIIGKGSYILDDNELLEPELQSNQSLRIRSGMLYHHGSITEVKRNTYDEVTIANGSQGMKRIDLVVARYTKNPETEIEEMNWVVIQGTPAASDPVAPAYTEGNMQEGDLTDDCPVFEVHLDGIQVTEVVKLLKVLEGSLESLNSKMPICFGSADTDVITVTAPYDCKIVVDFSCLGWGVDGGYLEFTIGCDKQVKKEYEHTGGCEGRNTEYMPLIASACFSGLRKGQQYSFTRSNIYGTFGMSWNRRWSAWCIPE